jgi:transposase-like protein
MTASQSSKHHANHGAGRPQRRRFSEAYKLRILEEADRCTKPGDLGLILRREGLYSSHLASWRRWRRHAHPQHPESRKPATESQLKHENARIRRENTRLQLKLEHAEKLLGLQKKLADMMEAIDTPETDGSAGSSA